MIFRITSMYHNFDQRMMWNWNSKHDGIWREIKQWRGTGEVSEERKIDI